MTLDYRVELETKSWVVSELFTFSGASKLTQHCGWCTLTHGPDVFNWYVNEGKLYVFRKRGKRRPSYQLFVRSTGLAEFKHKGNEYADVWDFKDEQPELRGWLSERIPERLNVQKSINMTISCEQLEDDKIVFGMLDEHGQIVRKAVRETITSVLADTPRPMFNYDPRDITDSGKFIFLNDEWASID